MHCHVYITRSSRVYMWGLGSTPPLLSFDEENKSSLAISAPSRLVVEISIAYYSHYIHMQTRFAEPVSGSKVQKWQEWVGGK